MSDDPRLARKIGPIRGFAETHGWATATVSEQVDGIDAVWLMGVTDTEPGFGFSIVYGVDPETNRVKALHFDGNPRAVLVMTAEAFTDRCWYGPASAYERALADPAEWTGTSGEASA
jgi:hypothetical protein